MRWLFLIAVGYAAACGQYAYQWNMLWIFLGLAAATGYAFAVMRRKKVFLGALVVLCGFAAAFAVNQSFERNVMAPVRELAGREVTRTVTVTGESWNWRSGTAFAGIMKIGSRSYAARIYLKEEPELLPGDTVEGSFRMYATESSTSLPGKGIYLSLFQQGNIIVTHNDSHIFRYLGAKLRIHTMEILSAIFPEDAKPVALGIFLGDTSEIDYGTNTDLKICGMRHTVAVSGMHLGILFAIFFALSGKRPLRTFLFAVPVLILYAAMVGMTASVVRACIMMVIYLLSMVVMREYDSLTSLGAAVLWMLAGSPMTVTSAGFQLSVAGVLGIILLRKPIFDRLIALIPEPGGAVSRLVNVASVTAGAVIFTTPISALYFGNISLMGLLANPLLASLVTAIFVGTLAAAAAGFLWLPAGRVLAWAAAWMIRCLKYVIGILARFPLAAVYTASRYIVWWLGFSYVLLLLLVLKRGRGLAKTVCIVGAGLCLAVSISWFVPAINDCTVSVLNVGQGQSVILQSGNRVYLVDCGGDYDTGAADAAAEMLLSRGFSRIDGVIVSHLDADHCGGVPYFLQRVEADAVFLPDYGDTENFCDSLLGKTENVFLVGQDLVLESGNGKLSIFAPIQPGNDNESSLCVLFQTEKCDILITGDQTAEGERRMLQSHDIGHVTALVVGHHGASTSTSEELLRATTPEIAVISVGENAYGHPRADVLSRLTDAGCVIYRTDEMGTVEIRR